MNPCRQLLQMLRRARLHRFVLVGVLNTLVGYGCILALQALSRNPVFSNLLGFGLCAGFSYLTHSRLTFGHDPNTRSAGAYTLVLLVSFGLNLIVLKVSLLWLPPAAAQGLAVLSYAALSYLGQIWLVFPLQRRQSPGGADAPG